MSFPPRKFVLQVALVLGLLGGAAAATAAQWISLPLAGAFKIVQTPGVTIVLYEMFNQFRQIFTDGRRFPVDPNPAWYGYSVGAWARDTLLVESQGFKEG